MFREAWRRLFRFLWSPFTPFLIVTFACNLALVFWGYRSLNDQCEQSWWLRANAVFALVNIHGGLYLVVLMHREKLLFKMLQWWYNPGQLDDLEKWYYFDDNDGNNEAGSFPDKQQDNNMAASNDRSFDTLSDKGQSVMGQVSQTTPSEMESTSDYHSMTPEAHITELSESMKRAPSSHERLGRVLYNDVGVLIYLCLAVLWIVWQSVGIRVALGMLGDYVEQCGMVRNWIRNSLICGAVYICVAFLAFDCSLLCIN